MQNRILHVPHPYSHQEKRSRICLFLYQEWKQPWQRVSSSAIDTHHSPSSRIRLLLRREFQTQIHRSGAVITITTTSGACGYPNRMPRMGWRTGTGSSKRIENRKSARSWRTLHQRPFELPNRIIGCGIVWTYPVGWIPHPRRGGRDHDRRSNRLTVEVDCLGIFFAVICWLDADVIYVTLRKPEKICLFMLAKCYFSHYS